jgi:hypothetical protein
MSVHESDLEAHYKDFTQAFQVISLIASNDLLQMHVERRFYKQTTMHAMRKVQELERKYSRYSNTTRKIFSGTFLIGVIFAKSS